MEAYEAGLQAHEIVLGALTVWGCMIALTIMAFNAQNKVE